ncbi:MAG TPA: DUF742 domain-containing protein [Pseudonocardia sp.]|uniref:DUF742 domain-containing protein n=1 Tax=Pseudonocardia sp. TaxID=60912 RepID=UPI002B4B7166|nr:DUF742 domain-containing protein [Pseudonocardia sp.]HLU57881.1 DUF742 domain-containing protein [Pseudonocardia sp.]
MHHSVCRPVVTPFPRAPGAPALASRVAGARPPGPGGGPVGPEHDLPVESVVTATERARWGRALDPEARAIVELARRPVSLVEIGAALGVPVAAVRGRVHELAEGGFLHVHATPAFPGGRPPGDVLARLLRGLRR